MYNLLFTSGGSNTATATNTNTNTGRRIVALDLDLDFLYSIFSNLKNISSWELNPGQDSDWDSFKEFWER